MRHLAVSLGLLVCSWGIPVLAQPTVRPTATVYQATELATLPLVNVKTGSEFKLADFAGKTVLVQMMATWCGNCRIQMGHGNQARQQLNSDRYVFVALNIDTNVPDQTIADYARAKGFDWVFATATPEMLKTLNAQLGRMALVPPVTPIFFIRPDGSLSDLNTGQTFPPDLVSKLKQANSGGSGANE